MASGEMVRASKGDPPPGRDRHRDNHPPNAAPASSSGVSQTHPDGGSQIGSLQARIGGKETPRSLPQVSPNSYRPEVQRKEDDRDSRKRTATGLP